MNDVKFANVRERCGKQIRQPRQKNIDSAFRNEAIGTAFRMTIDSF